MSVNQNPGTASGCGPTPDRFWFNLSSLIYQLLPIVSEKLGRPKASKAIVVIVCPLVALMEEQVKGKKKKKNFC